jgi:hypothetical protein
VSNASGWPFSPCSWQITVKMIPKLDYAALLLACEAGKNGHHCLGVQGD